MTKQSSHAAVALRPGSIFHAFDKLWKVTGNDTLNQILELREYRGSATKRLRYRSTTVINCRWVPFNSR